jgi:hypothetical protein
MAIVGDAYIVVKAITTGFESEVRRAASGIDLDREGRSVGDTFSKGFGRGVGGGLTNSLSTFAASADAARKRFQSLVRTSFIVGPALSVLVSTIGTLVAGLVSLASSLVAAAPSAIVLASALTSVGIAAIGLRAALSGVGKAISAGTKANLAGKKSTDAVEQATKRLLLATERVTEAQKDFTDALKDAREEIQQLGFDAEDAALAESKAAIELEKARETLQRVQDLAPNTRARREANLAFQEAELNLRRAKDRNSDLRKEQERLAKSAIDAGIKLSSLSEEDKQEALARQTDTYLNAQKNLVDSLRDQKDAEEDVAKAREGGTADTSFRDALADLSKEAQGFVKYMVNTFIPSLKTLRDALGRELFSQLESNLERLRTVLFPALRPVLVQLGDDIGKAFTKITDGIVNPRNIEKLNKVIIQSGINIQSYATTLANLYESFLTLLVGAEPLINRFNTFVENKTAFWADFLNLQEASGELTKFFNKAGDIAARLGSIFGNLFGGISNITKANFSPGGGGYILIEWLDEVLRKFDSFSGSVSGQQALQEYFKDVAVNAKAVLQSLGAFVKIILQAGADPNIARFWDILKGAAPILGSIFTQLNAAGPALAEFIVSLFRFAEVTLTTGAIQNFLGVLTTALNTLSSILASPGVKGLFDFGSRLLAFFLAFGTIAKLVKFAGFVVSGSLIAVGNALRFLASPLAGATGLFSNLKLAVTPLAAAFGVTASSMAIALGAITAIVAVLVVAYNKSEIFREAVSNLATTFTGTLKGAFDQINSAIERVAPSIGGISGVFKALGDFLGRVIVPIFSFIMVNAIKQSATVISGLITVVGRLITAFSGVAGAVQKAFSIVIGVVRGAINSLINVWNSTLGRLKITLPKIGPFGGGTIGFPTIPNFAEGGVVYPSSQGTLARVAEAGRPERIEPLDPDGLSKRDKAMIKLLSGEKGGGMTVNVYPSPGMDETELASLVSRQIAFQLRRGGA